ncbi:ATPase [Agrobacterium vitis]|uniref:ATPase n=1 Tax=Agrobacterium vitis TaxID=373 RepID=A0A6L6VN82_AGRVI|nr:ATP12 family protein [Agrobacterium vitis]MCF1467495.1 ATPase [Agrobacterium vitis]MUZ74882.1 ATPase [Agrobacterium vitis]
MRDIFEGLTPELSDPDPVRRAQIQMKKPLPKRFYKDVTIAAGQDGHAVLLDGKTVKTPARNALVLPTEPLAALVASEWQAQAEVIDPATMPVTRLVNTALDAVSTNTQEVLDDIVRFCGNDMLCYRADAPQELVERQSVKWDPVLDWLADTHGARVLQTSGIIHQPQPSEATEAFGRALQRYRDGVALASLHVMTTLTGSAILALALADGKLTLLDAWDLAHLDENWTDEHWGSDMEAEARRAARFVEMQSAYNVLRAARA